MSGRLRTAALDSLSRPGALFSVLHEDSHEDLHFEVRVHACFICNLRGWRCVGEITGGIHGPRLDDVRLQDVAFSVQQLCLSTKVPKGCGEVDFNYAIT